MRLVELLEEGDLCRIETDRKSGDRGIELRQLRGADDWGGHTGLREQPGECDLRRSHVAALRELGGAGSDREIGVRVVQLVREIVGPGAHRFSAIRRATIACQET